MKTSEYSIIRDGEYKELSGLVLNGEILDVGGSKRSGYHGMINGDHKITTVNINTEYGCDLVFDIQRRFPLSEKSFDHIICLNVLEHIYNFQNVVAESSRVLKDGGSIILATPFMFHIHGSPDDYFRFTKSSLNQLLLDNNFRDIRIKELGFGLFSLLFQSIEPAIPFVFFKKLIKYTFVFIDKTLLLFIKRYDLLRNRIPLGYFVVARR